MAARPVKAPLTPRTPGEFVPTALSEGLRCPDARERAMEPGLPDLPPLLNISCCVNPEGCDAGMPAPVSALCLHCRSDMMMISVLYQATQNNAHPAEFTRTRAYLLGLRWGLR
jgi:hypothetical protein